jgi:RNA polymerase sigma factor (sigma-70 family)
MEKTIKKNIRKRKFHQSAESLFTNLVVEKNNGHIAAFNKLLLKLMTEVEKYVRRRLKRATSGRQISGGSYVAQDFIDELFVEAYDNFDEVGNAKELYPWLFKKVDELFEDAIEEEEFDMLTFENIDDYSQQEWDAMEEKYSVDGDGDLVMLEELDDPRLNKNDYSLNQVFIEDTEQELAVKLDRSLDRERIQNHIDMVLRSMPSLTYTVFDLFNQRRFEMDEIAKIKNITIAEVEHLLAEARKILRLSFSKRYLIDSN